MSTHTLAPPMLQGCWIFHGQEPTVCLLFLSLNPISQNVLQRLLLPWTGWLETLSEVAGEESTCRAGQNPHLLKALFWSKMGLLAEGNLICLLSSLS